MVKSLITLSGFILLLCIGVMEPYHTHKQGFIYSTNMRGVEVKYCVTTEMILIEGEHKQTNYRIRYE